MVRDSAIGIERILVHCELDLGMRRIEVIRLKVQDFKPGRRNIILIHGKGMNGGKWRQINWHPETAIILRAWLEQREAIVRKARKKNPNAIDPGNLLIYENNGRIGGYRKTAIDNVLANLGKRLGFHVSNHDLRRTCGRMMFRAEVPIEVIAKILGHSDIRTTLHYLGLDYEDMSSAFLKYSEYQRNTIVPQMVQNELSQEIGGPNGIWTHENDCQKVDLYRSRYEAPVLGITDQLSRTGNLRVSDCYYAFLSEDLQTVADQGRIQSGCLRSRDDGQGVPRNHSGGNRRVARYRAETHKSQEERIRRKNLL